MNNGRYYQKVVVITGGSSGIGLAVAMEFAARNAHLVIVGRDEKKLHKAALLLNEIAGGRSAALVLAADVSDKEQISAAINQAGESLGRIDLLINCAGIITCGRFSDQSVEDLERCLSVNYMGAVYASKAAWPWLKRSAGHLSFVSSVAGYIGLIGYSSYAPSKFALRGLAECLRMEGKKDNIGVSIIYPPDTDTPFLQYERQHTLPESLALTGSLQAVSAEKVAKFYLRGLQRNQFEIYCGVNSRFIQWLKNNFPGLFRLMTDRIIKQVRKKTPGRGLESTGRQLGAEINEKAGR